MAKKEKTTEKPLINRETIIKEAGCFAAYVHMREESDDAAPISFVRPDAFMGKEENYKRELVAKAREQLNREDWKGGSDAVECVKAAMGWIGPPKGNLIDYREKQNYFDAKITADPKGAEQLFRQIFQAGSDEALGIAFNAAKDFFGNHYATIAGLFFIKDSKRFLPLRTHGFAKALKMMNIEYKLYRLTSWENYCGFLAIIEEIRQILSENLKTEEPLELIDAHSFVWTIQTKEYQEWKEQNRR